MQSLGASALGEQQSLFLSPSLSNTPSHTRVHACAQTHTHSPWSNQGGRECVSARQKRKRAMNQYHFQTTVIPMLIPCLSILAAALMQSVTFLSDTTFSVTTFLFYIQQVLYSSTAMHCQSIKANKKTKCSGESVLRGISIHSGQC